MLRKAVLLLSACILVIFPLLVFSQWDPDAGLIESLTSNSVVTASSQNSSVYKVIDGDDQTFWQSGAPLPSGYIDRKDLNILLGLGNGGYCSSSGVSSCDNITDGDLNTSTTVSKSGTAWIALNLPSATPLTNISVKCSAADTVFVYAFTSNQDSVLTGYFTPASNYQLLRYPQTLPSFTKLKLISKESFSLFEVAALSDYPTEFVTIDLGSVTDIGVIVTRHWSGGAAVATKLLVSTDSINWQLVANLNPDALTNVVTNLSPPVSARYVRISHAIEATDYAKVYIWEAEVYDDNGRYGPMPSATQSDITLAEMLGVNGIWGWGYNVYSNSLNPGEGPTKFNKITTHARNYHNLHWDVSDPDSIPDYEGMPGSLALWWLDWDREYQAWVDANLKVGVTITYNNNTAPQSSWDDPYTAAYNYAYAFARHFGPTFGNGLVEFFEAGNEPWDYPASFYTQIQQGMIRGAKAGDSALIVLPCALQSSDPFSETSTGGNYMGARLTQQDAPYIDAINVHYYSYSHNNDGVRIAVPPESKESEMHRILNDIRFRDANLPDKDIYLTEWGWDSDGAGEDCTFGECVSENEQALYAVRGAMMFLRLGIDRITWYFYGNQGSGDLYSRCGLESTDPAHESKKSFVAFQSLLYKLGNKHFLKTIREDDEAWVYLFGDSTGAATHLAAWRPIKGDDTSSVWITIQDYLPDSAWTINGLSSTGEYAPSKIIHDSVSTSCLISSAPLIIEITNVDCKGVINGTAVRDQCGVCEGDNSTCSDCAGVPNGIAYTDDCGICSGGTTGLLPNASKDCAGVCFGKSMVDCNGDCNGTAFIDDCGVCSGGNTGHVPNSDQDCNGVCFGSAIIDCNGDCNGTAFIDDCGVCSGGNTGLLPNADKDCKGICFGSAYINNCGECTTGNDSCLCIGGITDLTVIYHGQDGVTVNVYRKQNTRPQFLIISFSEVADGDTLFIDGSGLPNGTLESTTYFVNKANNVKTGINTSCSQYIQGQTFDYYTVIGFTDGSGNVCGGGSGCPDCAGVVNGAAFIDDCGICSGGTSGHVANSDQDCNGVCFGTAVLDDCGVCGGDNSTCTDCAGVPNGTAFIDDCGICSGGTTGHVLNSDQDCKGVCFGKAVLDDCGVCEGDNSTCTDCAGVINGSAFVDDCGICSGGTTNHVANSDQDCNGVCFGTAELDSCGVCGGDNSTCIDCAGVLNGGAFIDDCGICSGGTTGHVPNSDQDCNGVCFGTALLDSCGVCGGDNSSCTDCAGVLNGSAFVDDCGICSGGTTGQVPNSDQDCNGVCFGTAMLDSCGVCGGNNSTCGNNCELQVVSFMLVGTGRSGDIGPLQDGDVIDLGTIGPFNIRADLCTSPVGSVEFILNGSVFTTDNGDPYSLGGDNNHGSFQRWNASPGSYRLTAIPYSGPNGTGTQGISYTVNFQLIDGSSSAKTTLTGITDNVIYDNLSIYPNPNSGIFTIALTPSTTETTFKVEMFNYLGQRVFFDKNTSAEKRIVHVQYLASGIYFLRIQTKNIQMIRKVVIESQ